MLTGEQNCQHWTERGGTCGGCCDYIREQGNVPSMRVDIPRPPMPAGTGAGPPYIKPGPLCLCLVRPVAPLPSSGMAVLKQPQTPHCNTLPVASCHTTPKSAIQTLARQVRQAQARPLTGCCQRRVNGWNRRHRVSMPRIASQT